MSDYEAFKGNLQARRRSGGVRSCRRNVGEPGGFHLALAADRAAIQGKLAAHPDFAHAVDGNTMLPSYCFELYITDTRKRMAHPSSSNRRMEPSRVHGTGFTSSYTAFLA